MHCHIEFHVVAGFVGTLIEAPDLIDVKLPKDHTDVCRAYPEPIAGNAAGNLVNPLNLTGTVTTVPTINEG